MQSEVEEAVQQEGQKAGKAEKTKEVARRAFEKASKDERDAQQRYLTERAVVVAQDTGLTLEEAKDVWLTSAYEVD